MFGGDNMKKWFLGVCLGCSPLLQKGTEFLFIKNNWLLLYNYSMLSF